jgi:hypothetical protein
MDKLTELTFKLPPGIEKAVIEFLQVMTYGAWAWTGAGAAIALYFVMKARSHQ